METLSQPPMSPNPPRFLIIGAGSRGLCYAQAVNQSCNGIIAAVAEPNKFKRESLGRNHIWGLQGGGRGGITEPKEGQSFADWREFVEYEHARRRRVAAGEENVPEGVDGAFVCVLDGMHKEVVVGLAPLGIHIMCEKPLAPSLNDCLDMYTLLKPLDKSRVFAVGHVLRYSPHNMLLRKLLVEDKVIGNIYSAVHTEPVGWWHFAHSYVRGSWRSARTSAPSLLTKCCHDVDLIMWLLSSPEKCGHGEPTHLPASVSSTGGLQFFKKNRKPAAAGSATNCTKCPLGDSGCKYSAKNIYLGPKYRGIESGNTDWPVSVVVNDIEDFRTIEKRKEVLTKALEEDWDESTPRDAVSSRSWFGRCVYESDNDVCDEQLVTITWPETQTESGAGKTAKRATIHMVAHTKKQCDRYSHFYGDEGEIFADSETITVEDFVTGETRTYNPDREGAGHGGGDVGLARHFTEACDRVKNHGWGADMAQAEVLGCTLEDVVRSHAMVFAAEDARLRDEVVRWEEWWDEAVMKRLDSETCFR